ncbi:hypothetical protein CA85_10300 [Allorhodopirellula solitaria]|uniref:Uncharacterized protein n=1 Tax=Allorhodopirellula solitaria TaxID=2527987 RepID=A0A5C5YGR7_9BACT|nr:hypothetical protein CA85_10300 [Allorhodopirellula solitaria]
MVPGGVRLRSNHRLLSVTAFAVRERPGTSRRDHQTIAGDKRNAIPGHRASGSRRPRRWSQHPTRMLFNPIRGWLLRLAMAPGGVRLRSNHRLLSVTAFAVKARSDTSRRDRQTVAGDKRSAIPGHRAGIPRRPRRWSQHPTRMLFNAIRGWLLRLSMVTGGVRLRSNHRLLSVTAFAVKARSDTSRRDRQTVAGDKRSAIPGHRTGVPHRPRRRSQHPTRMLFNPIRGWLLRLAMAPGGVRCAQTTGYCLKPHSR